ncbi:uncharacterized protein LOC126770820 isoform X2 [Nymphalis io]|uniref:uncharacterized protein LOC126770820 isoform X2 n=1 Tax=Inachis io TaxID=171585 RepID=UPI00216A7EA9|nr:uncharacterized protein LOC126770820 isoform X2 [Nymphalis io]
MDWRTSLVVLSILYHVNGFSKYGRTCKDIGCLNSEVCVLAEDPCSYGRASDCGTYPTCKKKTQVEGSHSEPARPSVPKPVPQSPTRDFDSPPSYPAPAPPTNTHSGSPYGSNVPSGGNSPYGSRSPYDNSPYGNNGGSSPYGGNSPYGGSSNRGGSQHGGGSNPYSPSTNGGFGGTGGKSPLDSIFNTLNNFANGGSTGSGSGSSSGSGLSNIFGNILGNLSKSGGLNGLFNTRPIMENPSYSSYSSNSRSSNPQNYPSGNSAQPAYQQPNYNKNYGQNNAHRSGATTRKPVHYGWNVSVTVIFTYLIQLYIQNIIRN